MRKAPEEYVASRTVSMPMYMWATVYELQKHYKTSSASLVIRMAVRRMYEQSKKE